MVIINKDIFEDRTKTVILDEIILERENLKRIKNTFENIKRKMASENELLNTDFKNDIRLEVYESIKVQKDVTVQDASKSLEFNKKLLERENYEEQIKNKEQNINDLFARLGIFSEKEQKIILEGYNDYLLDQEEENHIQKKYDKKLLSLQNENIVSLRNLDSEKDVVFIKCTDVYMSNWTEGIERTPKGYHKYWVRDRDHEIVLFIWNASSNKLMSINKYYLISGCYLDEYNGERQLRLKPEYKIEKI